MAEAAHQFGQIYLGSRGGVVSVVLLGRALARCCSVARARAGMGARAAL